MNEEVEEMHWFDALVEKYPDMFQTHYAAVGKGWATLITRLCDQIHWRVKNYDLEMPKVVQIKEKFGELRFYYHGGDDYIRGLVDMAESISNTTCDVCGDKGHRRNDGWNQVICDRCYDSNKRS